MKVILNADVKSLGELGDVKNVANGYARNYLFPHMFAVPYNEQTVAYFESRKEEIEARKAQKRADAKSLKEKLEGTSVEFVLPAAANGKLFGSVTSLTIADYLSKNGYEIERKRIEIPGLAIKTVGNFHCVIHLYEAETAEVKISVKAQPTDKKEEPARKPRAEKKDEAAASEAPATDASSADEDAPAAEEKAE